MKVIIAGSRGITSRSVIFSAIEESGFLITEVVEGECPDSPDVIGKEWARRRGIPVTPFPAKWKDLNVPGAVIKRNRRGELYNARAGHDRNRAMAEYVSPGGGLILIHFGNTPGSQSMLKLAYEYKIQIFEKIVARRN